LKPTSFQIKIKKNMPKKKQIAKTLVFRNGQKYYIIKNRSHYKEALLDLYKKFTRQISKQNSRRSKELFNAFFDLIEHPDRKIDIYYPSLKRDLINLFGHNFQNDDWKILKIDNSCLFNIIRY